ncbi:hypothetical protein H0H92_013793, partial [Tricholoma furcatifolium]
ELLIDFQELIGEHSGENMAAAVWSTLTKFNLEAKLLEGIGAVEKPKPGKYKRSAVRNYQDDITAPLDRKFDSEAAPEEEENDSTVEGILPAVSKLRTIIRAVRVSPQRREAWYQEVERTKKNAQNSTAVLMLILDVKTRWSSTHQMLRECFINPMLKIPK